MNKRTFYNISDEDILEIFMYNTSSPKCQSFGHLQQSGKIKFKPNIPVDVLKQIRLIQISKNSLDKINMRLRVNDELADKLISSTNEIFLQLFNYQKIRYQILKKMIHIFSLMEAVYLEEIKFYKDCCDPMLLMTVANVKFHQLEYIDFSDCNLGSLQFLSFLDIPQLKRLILKSNNITHLNSLAKVNFPKLFWIQSQDNQIKNAKGLSRSQLASIFALLEVSQKKNRVMQDAFTYLDSWFFKLPFEHINYIRKNEKNYLFGSKFDQKAKQKYPNINFR